LKVYVEEDQKGFQFTNAEKEGVEGGKERRNGWRVIGGREKKGRSRVGGKGGKMWIQFNLTFSGEDWGWLNCS